MAEVSAIILAAGRATRFGSGPATSKVLALLEGRPLVRLVAEAALASRASAVIVVTGQAAAGVRAALDGLAIRFVDNPAYAGGMASSLRAGLACVPDEADGALVLLADMPRVTTAIIDRLIGRFEEEGGLDAVVPVRAGRQGNPVLLGRPIFGAVATLVGDQGARRILNEKGRRLLECLIEDAAIEADVDTPEALEALQSGKI